MIDSTNPRILADNIRHLIGDVSKLSSISSTVFDTGMKWIDKSTIYGAVLTGTTPAEGNATNELAFTDILWWSGRIYHSSKKWYSFDRNVYAQFTSGESFTGLVITPPSATYQGMEYQVIVYFLNNTNSTLILSTPDDSRSIEPEVREEAPEAEPIEEPVAEVKKTTRKKSTN